MLRLLRVDARFLARPTGLEGWKSLDHEKIAAGPRQPRSLVSRGERAGYVNNPPRLQLEFETKQVKGEATYTNLRSFSYFMVSTLKLGILYTLDIDA